MITDNTLIDDIDWEWTVREYNALLAHGITKVGQLCQLETHDMSEWKNCGKVTIAGILSAADSFESMMFLHKE